MKVLSVFLSLKMPYLNYQQRIKLFRAFDSKKKVNFSALARELGCKRNAIHYQLNKYQKEYHQNLANVPKTINRSKSNSYTAQEEINILSFFDLHPFASFSSCKKLLNLKYAINTIRKILKENGMENFVSKRKPFMNLSHQAKRYLNLLKFASKVFNQDTKKDNRIIFFFFLNRKSFALKTKKWKNEWYQVVFSDEKIFQSYSNGKVLVKRKRGESENPKYINFAIQQQKISLNIWCCVSYGRKPIIYLAGNHFDSTKYIQIIDDVIKNRLVNFKDNYIFQQDNASIHVSKTAKAYFAKEKLSILIWPPCSPDLNIVEQIWSIIQKKLDTKLITTRIKDEEHLFQIVNELAGQITINQVNNLFDSMKDRIKCVLNNSGGFTRF